VLLKDIQKNVVTRATIHVDLFQLSMTKKIEISIPIVLSGDAPGVKEGGVLTLIIRELKVKCLPTEIPDNVTVDISSLQIGGTITVKDLQISKNVEVLVHPTEIVVNIVKPTILEEVVAGTPAETAAEPEVIGKGKKELEEGEEAAGAAAEPKKEAAAPKKDEKKPEKK
jgi:large subunit ribosomal protein L25